MYRFIIILILLFTTIFASSNDLEKVTFQLNWKYQFEFAGFIAAKEKGYYKEHGLDVELKEYESGLNVLDDLKNEKITYGIYDLSLLSIYDEKNPIKLIANYFKRSGLVFITRQDITTPEDLRNKIIMAEEEELISSSLGTLLKKFEIKENEYILKEHNFSANDFINGKIDVMSAYLSNELFHIRESKIPFNIIDPLSYGVYGSGLNVFATQKEISNNPQRVKKFIEATNAGWMYALNNKEEIADIIYEKYSKIKSKKALLFEAKQVEKLITPNIYKIGEINKMLLERNLNDLRVEGLLKKDIDIDNIVYKYKKEKDYNLLFTNTQKRYIENKKEITMCIDPDWMPYEKLLPSGEYMGMTSDYIPLISEKIGIPITLVPTKTWSESIEYAKKRKCDIFSLAMPTASRLKYMKFTSPYISFPIVIATKVENLFISNPEEIIKKEKIGIVKGYAIGEILKKRYPNHKIIDVKNVELGMKMVERGQLFGFLDALPAVAYSLQHNYINTLKISGKLKDNFELSIGVRNDDPILFELFQKAVESIPEIKKQEILNKYIAIKVEGEFDYKLFYTILFVVSIIILIGLYRHRELLKYNKTLEKQRKELELTQDNLQSAIKDFELLLDSTLEALFVFEKQVCIDVNTIGVRMFAYENKSELIGKSINKLFTNKSLALIIEKTKLNDELPYELEAVKKDGTVFNIMGKGTNIVLNSKDVRISAIVDITEMKQKDKLLFQQSKMAAMGEMLENIAHQWRQPLSLISTISTGIGVKADFGIFDKEEDLKSLKKINITAQYLSKTIDDFRNFFKADRNLSKFSVYELIQKNIELLDSMFKHNNIEIVCEEIDDLIIESYENELTQALINIFYNAKDAMQNIFNDKFIFISLKREKDFMVILIKDIGGGVDESIIENIFEPYFTTKHKSQGTGVGLYMTHQIIEKHINGSITVNNESFEYKNKKYIGAQFIIKIPLS